MTTQSHSQFKVFTGAPVHGALPAEVLADFEAFTKDGNVAAKSIGVEYDERTNKLVLSLGYRDDEPGYPVSLKCVSIGILEVVPETIAAALSAAAAAEKGVICHEFYIAADGEFFVVFLSA